MSSDAEMSTGLKSDRSATLLSMRIDEEPVPPMLKIYRSVMLCRPLTSRAKSCSEENVQSTMSLEAAWVIASASTHWKAPAAVASSMTSRAAAAAASSSQRNRSTRALSALAAK